MTQPSPQAPGAPAGGGNPGQAPGQPQQQGTVTNPAAPAAPPATNPGQAPGTDPQDVASLPQWAQDVIKNTRTEAANYRTQHQTVQQQAQEAQKQRDAVLAAMGLKPDGTEAVDPDKLGAQLADVQSRAWETAVENKVLRMAGRLGLDADGLLDSLAFLDSLQALDAEPEAADFAQKLEAHVTAFVTANPKFKATPAPQGAPRGGGDFGGGPNLPPASLDAQIADAEKRRDHVAVIRLKRQKAAQQP